MNLILWRHAEAVDLGISVTPGSKRDLKRGLTDRGKLQAHATAQWLNKRVKQKLHVVCSPALRTIETAMAYCECPEIIDELNPLADASHVLEAINWPQGNDVLVIGHQPWMGRVASLLLFGEEKSLSIKKSAIWWLNYRMRLGEGHGMGRTVLRLALPPDLADKDGSC